MEHEGENLHDGTGQVGGIIENYPHPSSADHYYFRGFGGVRHGFNNPSRLNRNRHTSPPSPRTCSQAYYDREGDSSLQISRRSGPMLQVSDVRSPSSETRLKTYDGRRSSMNQDLKMLQAFEAICPTGSNTPHDRNASNHVASQHPEAHWPTTNFMPSGALELEAPSPNRPSKRHSSLDVSAYVPDSQFQTVNRQSIASILNDPDASHHNSDVNHSNDFNDHHATHEPAPAESPISRIYQQPSLLNDNAQIVSPSWTPYSSLSTPTLQPIITRQEQRYLHLLTLHSTCLSATNHHLSLLRRRSRLGLPGYHPYSLAAVYPRSPSHPESLMDNIAAICDHLWRRARKNGMAPHNAEARAVRLMHDLYMWGEKVVDGLESEGEMALGDCGGRSMLLGTAVAAGSLCAAMRDERGRRICESLLEQVRALDGDGRIQSREWRVSV